MECYYDNPLIKAQPSIVAQMTNATNVRKLHAAKQSAVPSKNGLPVTPATSGFTLNAVDWMQLLKKKSHGTVVHAVKSSYSDILSLLNRTQ